MIANTNYSEFENRIGYRFEDISLLKLALTHSSYANEMTIASQKNKYNERIEFLGDAVLELISSDYIYLNMDMSEGDMTKYRASIVCEPTLAACARSIGLEAYIRLGKGEEATGGRKRDSIVSDAFEALIGAIYLDGGLANAKEFIMKYVLNDLENKKLFYDSKTILQEYVQKIGVGYEYKLVGEEGPEHDKTFIVDIIIDGEFVAQGKGNSKKHAQQHAAYNAILKIKEKDNIEE